MAFAKYITAIASSTFFFAALLNAQLTFNADMFKNEPEKFDARLTEMHTVKQQGVPVLFSEAKKTNYLELAKFFKVVSR